MSHELSTPMNERAAPLHSPRPPRRVAHAVAFATLLGALLLASPSTAQAPQAPSAVELPATVEPYEQAQLHARLSGYVTDVTADIGDLVKAGQVLARIDRPELLTELAQARAELAERESLVESAGAAVRQTEAAVSVAKRQIDRWDAEVTLQETTLRRQEELHAERAITAQQLDEFRAKAAISRADQAVAQARAEAAEADAVAARARHTVSQSQVAVAQAHVAHIDAQRSLLEIRAPFDGLVTERRMSRGDLAPATPSMSSALFTLQRIDRVRIRIDVPEHLAARAGRGAAIELHTGAGAPLTTQVTRTSGALDTRSRTLRVEIDAPNADGRWITGSFVRAVFTAPSAPAGDAK
jgi:multidrug resistance efflux pump